MLVQLERVPIFAGLEPEALELLVSRTQRVAVQAGALIVKEGEPGNRFFLIESGTVRVVKKLGTPDEV
ncbi:MAG: cyclic nucleotide-binding domain-containing protein, partial [Verrucomicrobia bacterium]|nr:cyclic nucleotide-binding domain-containing protein [Verrucomicrobiota bacterium]